jgi:transposase
MHAGPRLDAVQDLVERVRSEIGADEVYVLIEAGSSLWPNLFHAAGAVVHVVDPKQARRFAESQGSSGAKDDPRDSGSLVDMCRSASHRKAPWAPEPIPLQQLDVLAKLQEQRTKDRARTKQRLRDVLRNQMPLLDEALPSDISSDWVIALLRKVPTPFHARKLTRDELDRIARAAKPARRDRVWAALQLTKAPWIDAAMAKTIAVQVRLELAQLEALGKQLEEIDEQLERATGGMETRTEAESIDGIGLKMSTSLIQFAFRDGVPADRDQASIRLGASPVFSGSGKHRDGRAKGHVRMRRSAPARARRTAYLLGRLVMPRHAWAKAMFADGRKRGQNAATVYRRIARSVLRILSAMIRTGEPYDEARYVASLKANGVPWAATL